MLVLGAWVALDTSALLQLMVSQPLVAGWLAGLVVGAPGAGFTVGLLLQLLWGRSLPMGTASIPFMGPAAVAAGAVAGWTVRDAWTFTGRLPIPDAASLAVCLVLALVLGESGRLMVDAIGRRRGVPIRRAEAAAAQGHPAGVALANLSGALPTALLGSGLVAAGLIGGAVSLELLAGIPRAEGQWLALVLFGLGLGRTVSLVASRRLGWGWVAVTGAVILLLGKVDG